MRNGLWRDVIDGAYFADRPREFRESGAYSPLAYYCRSSCSNFIVCCGGVHRGSYSIYRSESITQKGLDSPVKFRLSS
jgi:hypothetical protein